MMPQSVQNFLWLNPIVEKMIAKEWDSVLRILAQKGYTVVQCTTGAAKIHDAYLRYISTALAKPVIDARCPKVAALIKHKYPSLSAHVAPIAPILSACAEELFNEYVGSCPERARLTVVAPCTALADEGCVRFGHKIRFVTWTQFSKEISDLKIYPRLISSPVPPGYFRSLGSQVIEANGESRVNEVLQLACAGHISPSVNLLEMLYCEGGCHNGDGVA
jgi:iron only hydrogenase large subunit-like protein